jgi:hypothetical protein
LAASAIILALLAGASAPITGGSPSSDTAVVALGYDDVLVCSGTVIAPQAVLTAGHCVMDSSLPAVEVGDALAGATQHPALAALVHPAFDPQTLDHDLAIVIVDPTLGVAPLPYATALAAAPGSTIRVVGYGWTVANDTAPPERRSGTSVIDSIDDLRLVSHAAPSQACEGDSGGPALFDDGTGERVVGVASSGDASCTQYARHTRVDSHADFIADVLARSAPGAAGPGDRCWYDSNCAAGACLSALDEPRWSFCAPACTDGGCPDGLTCITVGGDARCRHAAPSPGAEGAPCASDADCAGTLCRAASDGGETVCTQRCFSDLPGFTCPGTETCRAAADGMEACFAPADSGGCRAASGQPGLLTLLALGWLVQLLRGRGKPYASRRVSNVLREMPSMRAARVWFPPQRSSASRMRRFSTSATAEASDGSAIGCVGISEDEMRSNGIVGPEARRGGPELTVMCSGLMRPPPASTSPRSIVLRSSRTLPGHG